MSGLFRFFGMSAVSLGVCALVGMTDAYAATGRAGYDNVRAASGAASVARMPSMPTLPLNSVGNISTNVPTGNSGATVPSVPDVPDVPDNPEPTPECPDGGVKNSSYTIDMCMNDVLRCVNNGALPNGLNDLFNEELRYAIENGMGLCAMQVERCVADVRRDCANVYRSSADVWIDFNSRKVQPEYYNFVLRKTGLTPNQAENTCRLLDKNTYGSSFTAVDNNGRTTAEYNQKVGAYNSQHGNVLVKTNPQGVRVNDGNPGVDGARGHYARWDAATATCLIRVAAYNKDKHISNNWLFGAVGDDQPAEVWRAAGDTFSCNKDLFGFSLMNDTSTVAVVGIGGGTLVGAGVGAIAGHGKREFNCDLPKHRELLMEEIKSGRTIGILNEYLKYDVDITQREVGDKACEEIVKLFDKYYQYETAIAGCMKSKGVKTENINISGTIEEMERRDTYVKGVLVDSQTKVVNNSMLPKAAAREFAQEVGKALNGQGDASQTSEAGNGTQEQGDATENAANGQGDASEKTEAGNGMQEQGNAESAEGETQGTAMKDCLFDTFNLDKAKPDASIYVNEFGKTMNAQQVAEELNRLDSVFGKGFSDLMLNGEKSNMAKSIGIGAAVGAGTGGLATAITAFVERNNINCRVGDGLAQVGFNKSYSIDTLKDFYVKWNLRVPDVVAPTATISDCASWKNTCATFADLEQCADAQFNYKPDGAATTTLIRSACTVSGSACIENYPVAKSHGACE